MSEIRIKDIEKPGWIDEWLWDSVVAQFGDLVIAKSRGSSVGVCPCCSEIHSAPVLEQEGHALSLVFDRLGVTAEPQRAGAD